MSATEHIANRPVAEPVDGASGKQKERRAKPKKTYMLHDPNTFASLGKFVSTDFRYAALKAASRGHSKILLRITDTKLVYEFEGQVVSLDTPQVVKRGEREITYSKKPVVKFVKKFVYEGDVVDDDDDVLEESKPKKKREGKRKKAENDKVDDAVPVE